MTVIVTSRTVYKPGVSSEERKACGWWWCSPAEPASLSSRRPANVEERTENQQNETGKVYTNRMSSSYETSVKATVLTSDSVAKSARGHCLRAGLVRRERSELANDESGKSGAKEMQHTTQYLLKVQGWPIFREWQDM